MHVFCLVTRLVHIAASMGVSFGASGWGSQRGEEHRSSRRIVPYMREPLDAYPTASPQCHTGHGGMGAGICPRARAGTSYGWGGRTRPPEQCPASLGAPDAAVRRAHEPDGRADQSWLLDT